MEEEQLHVTETRVAQQKRLHVQIRVQIHVLVVAQQIMAVDLAQLDFVQQYNCQFNSIND